MFLKTGDELTDFLADLSQAIKLLNKGKAVPSFNKDNKKLFVDPLMPGELRFMIQLHNEIAMMNCKNKIDLDAIWNEKLRESGLSGVNTDEIDRNLLIFLSKYNLVIPSAHNQQQPSQLTSDIAELKSVQQQLDENHYHKKPLDSLIQLAECNNKPDAQESFEEKPSFITYNNLNKMVTETRKLVAPKLGEKNCFSYNARLKDYKTQARLNGLASFGNGVLGAISTIVGSGMMIGAVVGASLLLTLTTGPLLLWAFLGFMAGISFGLFPGAGVAVMGAKLLNKANYQRRMSGTMFSVANAGQVPAPDDAHDDKKNNDTSLPNTNSLALAV